MYNQTIQSNSIHAGSLAGAQASGLCQPARGLGDVPVNTLVASTCLNIHGRAGRLHELANRIERATDRVFGTRPTAVPDAQKNPQQDCDASRLGEAFDYLDMAIARLEDLTGRVEQI